MTVEEGAETSQAAAASSYNADQTTAVADEPLPKRAKHATAASREEAKEAATAADDTSAAAADVEVAVEEADQVAPAAKSKSASHRKKAKKKKQQQQQTSEDGDQEMDDDDATSHAAGPADSSTAAAVVSRSKLPAGSSFVSRCDNNSLSVVFQFLNAHDFASCIRVSKQFRSVSAMNTAWPKFDLQRFIRQLENDDYDNPAHRRVIIKSATKIFNSPTYVKANEVIVRRKEVDIVSRLAELHHLTALNIEMTTRQATAPSVIAFADAMQHRLQVLILTTERDPDSDLDFAPIEQDVNTDYYIVPSLPFLRRLTSLAVLVIDVMPPLETLL